MTPPPAAKTIAKANPNQPNWRDRGMPDLRRAGYPAEDAPRLLPGAASHEQAVELLRAVLGLTSGGARRVETPVGMVIIQDATLGHVVEKRQDQRERYAAFIVPTLERPSEVWAVGYDDGSTRDRYIKVFAGAKYDILIMVMVMEDGGVFWNMMNRDRAGMNALRIGDLRWMSQ
jgi:phage-Barnase-EndoU-ColicinE5/D-RelE like nuclease2